MVALDAEVRKRAAKAARVVARLAPVHAIYVFGSHVEGRADRWSDIDVALFLEGIERWDMLRRAQVMARVQLEAGLDVEAHLFPATAFDAPEQGSFAEYVIENGVRISNDE
jgi:predicted nucleotidyltransferase